jgi:hypothetical protein
VQGIVFNALATMRLYRLIFAPSAIAGRMVLEVDQPLQKTYFVIACHPPTFAFAILIIHVYSRHSRANLN